MEQTRFATVKEWEEWTERFIQACIDAEIMVQILKSPNCDKKLKDMPEITQEAIQTTFPEEYEFLLKKDNQL